MGLYGDCCVVLGELSAEYASCEELLLTSEDLYKSPRGATTTRTQTIGKAQSRRRSLVTPAHCLHIDAIYDFEQTGPSRWYGHLECRCCVAVAWRFSPSQSILRQDYMNPGSVVLQAHVSHPTTFGPRGVTIIAPCSGKEEVALHSVYCEA